MKSSTESPPQDTRAIIAGAKPQSQLAVELLGELEGELASLGACRGQL